MSNESQTMSAGAVLTLTPGSNGQPPLITSEQLFKDQNMLQIAHEGSLYLLRITRENKLILTK